MPDVAVLVDAETVGAAGALVGVEDARVGQGACGPVVGPGEDLLGGCVGEVEGFGVRGEAD